jgi:uncharacterized protein YdiU (UPF0061 family)
MEAVDPATVYSSIDTGGRYAYANQPAAAEWNLARFAESLLPLLADEQDDAVAIATESLTTFRGHYAAAWSTGMRAKLGLVSSPDDAATPQLARDLVELLQAGRVDHTSFFRNLSAAARGDAEAARGLFLDLAGFDAWADRWLSFGPDPDAMDRVNPAYVPRNHLVEESLTAATSGDLQPLERLLVAVSRPYDVRPGLEAYAEPAPDSFGTYRTFCGT